MRTYGPRQISVLLLTCLLGLPLAVQPEKVYRWVDETGDLHYGDRPGNESAEAVDVGAGARELDQSLDERRKRRARLLEVYEEERQIKRDAEQQARIESERRKRACHEARARLQDMQAGGMVWYELDKEGNRRYLTDLDLAGRIEAFRASVASTCGE